MVESLYRLVSSPLNHPQTTIMTIFFIIYAAAMLVQFAPLSMENVIFVLLLTLALARMVYLLFSRTTYTQHDSTALTVNSMASNTSTQATEPLIIPRTRHQHNKSASNSILLTPNNAPRVRQPQLSPRTHTGHNTATPSSFSTSGTISTVNRLSMLNRMSMPSAMMIPPPQLSPRGHSGHNTATSKAMLMSPSQPSSQGHNKHSTTTSRPMLKAPNASLQVTELKMGEFFTKFPEISTELRLKIWRISIDRGPLTITPWAKAKYGRLRRTNPTEWNNYLQLGLEQPLSVTIPITLHVNHESREETLRSYQPILQVDRSHQDFKFAPKELRPIRYFNPQKDRIVFEDGLRKLSTQITRLDKLTRITPASFNAIHHLEVWEFSVKWYSAWTDNDILEMIKNFLRCFGDLKTIRIIYGDLRDSAMFSDQDLLPRFQPIFENALQQLSMNVEVTWVDDTQNGEKIRCLPQLRWHGWPDNWDDDLPDDLSHDLRPRYVGILSGTTAQLNYLLRRAWYIQSHGADDRNWM